MKHCIDCRSRIDETGSGGPRRERCPRCSWVREGAYNRRPQNDAEARLKARAVQENQALAAAAMRAYALKVAQAAALAATVLVLLLPRVVSAAPPTCRPPVVLAGLFWVVTTSVPRLCLPPLAPWRALPGASAEFIIHHEPGGASRAEGRWTEPGRHPSAWSELGAPYKVLPSGVAPDADGNGLLTIGDDGAALIRDWQARDASRFDFDENGKMSARDGALFLRFVGGQLVR